MNDYLYLSVLTISCGALIGMDRAKEAWTQGAWKGTVEEEAMMLGNR